MSGQNSLRQKLFIALIIIMLLPIFQLPALLSALPADNTSAHTLVWCYPFYLIMSAWLAWICRERRPEMTWILLLLMLLADIAVWALVKLPLQ